MTEPELFDRMQSFDSSWRVSFAEAGLILKRVEADLLWQQRAGCTSFTHWVHLAAPYGSSTAFSAYRAVKELADIPEADLSKIPVSNIGVLRQLSTAVRSRPEVIAAAQYRTTAELVGMIKHDFPEQHMEQRKVLRFPADETQAVEIEEGIALAMQDGAVNKTEALVMMSISYRASAMLDKMAQEEK